MKKLVTTLCTIAALALVAQASFAANAVRISIAYGGGGGSGTYLYDFVELFNSSASPVNVGGWAIEYGSATGAWASSTTNAYVLPAGAVIQPCSYLLVQLGPAGTGGGPLPIAADYVTTNVNAGQASGKFGLFTSLQSNVVCNAEAAGTLVDKVAYGTANCFEGSGGCAVLTNATAAVRAGAGMTDTDNNASDFSALTVSGVTLHNAASGQSTACLSVPSMKATWGQLKSIYR